MEIAGGYVLHLDAMHEGDAPALMTGMDSLSEIVLGNVKLPSEHADHIVPFLQKLKGDYGTPAACVHDMGSGILKAVAEVFPDTRDFICHFHFLRDIGKDLIEPAYAKLRSRLRSHATSTRLHALARETRQCLVELGSRCAMLAKTIHGPLPRRMLHSCQLPPPIRSPSGPCMASTAGTAMAFPSTARSLTSQNCCSLSTVVCRNCSTCF